MSRIPGLRRVFRFAPSVSRVDADVDAELQFHFEMTVRDLVSSGVPVDDARREARRRFGDVDRFREQLGEIDRQRVGQERRMDILDAIRQDIRYAVRGLRLQPAFAAVVVLTFALGIGANATMFGILDRILLQPPAGIAEPERVMRVAVRIGIDADEFTTDYFSYPAYTDLRDNVAAFERVAMYTQPAAVSLGRGAAASRLRASMVSSTFFPTLGVRPALGRFITREEDIEPRGTPAAVISYGLWQRLFAGDSTVLGKVLELGAERYPIVGVAPKGFTGVDLRPVDVWVPVTAFRASDSGDGWVTNRDFIWMQIVARLRAGVTAEQAALQVAQAYQAGELQGPGRERRANRRYAGVLVSTNPADARRDDQDLKVSKLLAGVSLIVLLIACANVANLLLARALRRRREIAVRVALGVGRGRLIAQLLIESVVLALLGGLGALAVVRWGAQALRAMLFENVYWPDSPVDGRVLAFTALITLLTGIVTGMIPAIQMSHPDLVSALKQGSRLGSVHHSRTRSALLIAQAALSVVLLIGTGLFVRSLRNVNELRLGIETDRVLIASLDLRSVGYRQPEIDAIYRRMEERLRLMPGVERASVSAALPFSSSFAERIRLPGRDSLPRVKDGGPYLNAVTSGFFATTGMRILRGRGFTEGDRAGSARVAVVNETMAKLYWPGENAIGQCLLIGADSMPCTEVVGVAENSRRQSLIESETIQYFLPLGQHPEWMRDRTLLVRPRGDDPVRMIAQVQRELQGVAPNLPYAEVRPMGSLVSGELRPWRLGATMFGIFGGLALLVAAVGLYSVISYGVAQRMHEMGVRVALGAKTGDVLRLVVSQGVWVAVAGIAIGAAIALAAGQLVSSLLYETSTRDPLVFAVVALTLLLVAVAASLIPAWRATRVDPAVALRGE